MDGQPETSGAAASVPVILPFKITDMQEPHHLGQSADDSFGWGLDIPEGVELIRPKQYEFDYVALFGKTLKRCDFVRADGCQQAVLHFADNDRATIGVEEPCEPSTDFVLRIDNSLFDKLRELPGLEFTVGRKDPPRRSLILEKALVGVRTVKPEAFQLPADWHLDKHVVVGLKLRDPDEVPTRRTPNRLKWVSWMSCSERTPQIDENGSHPAHIVFRDLRLRYEENLEGKPSERGLPLENPYPDDMWAREESPPSPPESPPAKPFPVRKDVWAKPKATAAKGKGKGKEKAVEVTDDVADQQAGTAEAGADDADAQAAQDRDFQWALANSRETYEEEQAEEQAGPSRRRGEASGSRARGRARGAAASTAARSDAATAGTAAGPSAAAPTAKTRAKKTTATTAAAVAAKKRATRSKVPVGTSNDSAATTSGRAGRERGGQSRTRAAAGAGKGHGGPAKSGGTTTDEASAGPAPAPAPQPARRSRRVQDADKRDGKSGDAEAGRAAEMEDQEGDAEDGGADEMDVDEGPAGA